MVYADQSWLLRGGRCDGEHRMMVRYHNGSRGRNPRTATPPSTPGTRFATSPPSPSRLAASGEINPAVDGKRPLHA